MLGAHALNKIDHLKYIELECCFNCFLNYSWLCLFRWMWTNGPLKQRGPRGHLPPLPPLMGPVQMKQIKMLKTTKNCQIKLMIRSFMFSFIHLLTYRYQVNINFNNAKKMNVA